MARSMKKVTETDLRQQAIDQMNPELRAEFDKIEELTRKQQTGNIWYYHGIGQRGGRIDKDKTKYGEKAVELLAAALGDHSNTVHKAIAFAEYFNREQITAYLARAAEVGLSLSWTHFYCLVAIADQAQREELVETVLNRKLSSRALMDEIKKRTQSGTLPERVSLPRSVTGGLTQLEGLGTKFADLLGDRFDNLVIEPLSKLDDLLSELAEIKDPKRRHRLLQLTEKDANLLESIADVARDQSKALRASHKILDKKVKEMDARDEEERKAKAEAAKSKKDAAAEEAPQPLANGDGAAGNGAAGNGHKPTRKRERRPLPA